MERIIVFLVVLLFFTVGANGDAEMEVKKIDEGMSCPVVWDDTIAYAKDGKVYIYRNGKETDTKIEFRQKSYCWIELKEGKCVYPVEKKLVVYDISENRSRAIDTKYNCTSAILWNDGIIYVEWENYRTPAASGSQPKIYFYDFDTGEKILIAEGQLPYSKPPIVRDYLPYYDMEKGWMVYELNKKIERPLSCFDTAAPRYVSICESRIVYGSSGETHVYDIEKDREVFLCKGHPNSAYMWGNNLVCVDSDNVLVVFDIETMERILIQEVKKPGGVAAYENKVVWCDGEELYYTEIRGGK